MHLLRATASGEQHGLVKKLANSVPEADNFKNMKPDKKKEAELRRKHDAKLVKARYINHRGMHERLEMPYCKYGGDPIEVWKFIPNEVYEVPLGLVEQVNENPGLARRSDKLDKDGVPAEKDGYTERIHEFVPVGFGEA